MKRICVYCGSSLGRDPIYVQSAKALAAALAQRGLGLVYGGASVGVMGTIADEVLSHGGEVVGVMPDSLAQKELAHPNLTELYIVDTMHTRKAKMASLADGFIALPGGMGTLEELFEMLTWAQLGFHQKPIGLLNIDGYYDALLRFIDHTVQEGFVRPTHRKLLLEATSAEALLAQFETYHPVEVTKWLDRGDV